MTAAAAPPSATPTSADRVCDLLLHLETAHAHGFRLAAAVVAQATPGGGLAWRGVVHCVLAGRGFALTPDEARLVARCIAFEDRRATTGWLAGLFETAACDAEAMTAGRSAHEAA